MHWAQRSPMATRSHINLLYVAAISPTRVRENSLFRNPGLQPRPFDRTIHYVLNLALGMQRSKQIKGLQYLYATDQSRRLRHPGDDAHGELAPWVANEPQFSGRSGRLSGTIPLEGPA